MTKYKDQGPQVYRKFLKCFEDLPLATIIAGSVYTAHGGVFRGTIVVPSKRSKKRKKGHKYKADFTVDVTAMKLGSLDELLKARRTVLDPPSEGSNLIPGDVLWSDPSLQMGLSPNKERGIGLLWGPDITQQFLRTNHLKVRFVSFITLPVIFQIVKNNQSYEKIATYESSLFPNSISCCKSDGAHKEGVIG